ncbi:unnamed protein product [Heligmosomoides polygyrus]|uniref:COesterase domain-containing protein n=1 Tax=Heligmosomoides polygyrus TaxID=6339 RepID=A0A183G956_HELPZ|nr:unnamed protein product [Heligmosomoides polygyrus]
MLSGRFLVIGSVLSCTMLATGQLLHLNQGDVAGFEYTTKSGDVAEVFLAIPYAAPPLNDLRFEKPSPVKPWDDVLKGTEFGPTCHPHARVEALKPDPIRSHPIIPIFQAPPGGYPVLMWIHGGGYEIGSASLYGYTGFADFYIPQDIVVISVQYRIGVYGFFSSGDPQIPGNLGLFDMKAAIVVRLEWHNSIQLPYGSVFSFCTKTLRTSKQTPPASRYGD